MMKSKGKLIDEGFKNASIINEDGQQLKLGEKSFWVWKACLAPTQKKNLLLSFSIEFNLEEKPAEKEIETILEILDKNKLMDLQE